MDNKKDAGRKALVWFRRDLRLHDNHCLRIAAQEGMEIIPVFVWNPWEGGDWKLGEASRWWLGQALKALNQSIGQLGGELILKVGPAERIIPEMAQSLRAETVFFSRAYDPAGRRTQDLLESRLQEDGTGFQSFNNSLLSEPWEIQNGSGNPFQVFTPFWKKTKARVHSKIVSISWNDLNFSKETKSQLALDQTAIIPSHNWHDKLAAHWDVSESGAQKLIQRIPEEVAPEYERRRNHPEIDGTSRLSPYLTWGMASPRQVWAAVDELDQSKGNESKRDSQFLAEIGWREFSHHLLYHFPHLTDQPLRKKYENFPWREDKDNFDNWRRGKTGYPLVDAGMRQLWETGWMHNRVRMVVASFLVKHLLLPWQEGAKWFWDTLVDADLASNTQGWQWAAGCGADAAPYFRIFNPFGQGEKFDANGQYVREWIPEISKLPPKWIHQPWSAPPEERIKAEVSLGKDYPMPIVDHTMARHRALAALATLKKE
jgi:deoxyribodipyrimidine photo-lyase